MFTYGLPFDLKPCANNCGYECGERLDKCPTYGLVPAALQAECEHNHHLLQYLHGLPLEEIGVPEYHQILNRGVASTKNPNLIYPVNDEIYVHILLNPDDIRNFYMPIDPSFCYGLHQLLEQVERSLINIVDEDTAASADEEERLKAILRCLDRLVSVRQFKSRVKSPKNGRNRSNNRGKIILSPAQNRGLGYLLRRKLKGIGVLDPMIVDTNIEDISCSGLGSIFVEHRIFGGLSASIAFENHEDLDKFVVELAENIKHPVTFRDPCVDATLPDGSRINIVYGMDVSKRGSNFTIRKFSPVPLSIIDLIQYGTLDYNMAAYLSLICQEQMNTWVSGETASGKTSLMNALTTFVPPESKIVTIEDTPEVQVPHPNWIRGVSRGASRGGESSEVSMFDLLKAALRQRPNLIIVGEIRGVEGAIAFQAMQTGHACMSTFHAASVPKLIQRLTGNPIFVPKSYVDNLNVVVICQFVRLPNGSNARRVTSINEIVGYDSVGDAFSFMEVFTWNPLEDSFDFRGYQNSYLLEEKIAPRRGVARSNRQHMYALIKQRAEVLKRIHEQGIFNFYEVHQILTRGYSEGYFR